MLSSQDEISNEDNLSVNNKDDDVFVEGDGEGEEDYEEYFYNGIEEKE